MARVRMITRTIESNEFSCMVVNGAEVTTEVVTLGNLDGVKPEKVEQMIKEQLLSKGLLFVKINDSKKIETVLGMTEEDFIKYAKPIER